MVLVDTSVWIGLFRGKDALLGQVLSSLASRNLAAISGHVWVEFVGGFRSESRRQEYARDMRNYPWLETTKDAFELATEWRASYRKLGSGDAIIAATAHVHGASLLTLDAAFAQLAGQGLRVEYPR